MRVLMDANIISQNLLVNNYKQNVVYLYYHQNFRAILAFS